MGFSHLHGTGTADHSQAEGRCTGRTVKWHRSHLWAPQVLLELLQRLQGRSIQRVELSCIAAPACGARRTPGLGEGVSPFVEADRGDHPLE
jgi:hypothetical protein